MGGYGKYFMILIFLPFILLAFGTGCGWFESIGISLSLEWGIIVSNGAPFLLFPFCLRISERDGPEANCPNKSFRSWRDDGLAVGLVTGIWVLLCTDCIPPWDAICWLIAWCDRSFGGMVVGCLSIKGSSPSVWFKLSQTAFVSCTCFSGFSKFSMEVFCFSIFCVDNELSISWFASSVFGIAWGFSVISSGIGVSGIVDG